MFEFLFRKSGELQAIEREVVIQPISAASLGALSSFGPVRDHFELNKNFWIIGAITVEPRPTGEVSKISLSIEHGDNGSCAKPVVAPVGRSAHRPHL